jgi:hypothetical protein
VYVLRRCGTENASALLTHYVRILTDYVPTDGSNNTAMTHRESELFPAFKSISEHFQKLDADDHLRQRVALAITTFMLRHKPHFVDASDADIIELGIARYTTSSEGFFKSIVNDEPLIIAGALKQFESRSQSIEETLRESICRLPIGPIRGYDLEAIGMYVLAQQLDGTKSLREIFNFQTDSIDIGKGKAHLIAIDEINQDGTLQYTIVNKPWLYPFGMGFEASDPSEHERWFNGTGVPFCFPDTPSGHDVGFFVLVDGNSVVFVTDQFKSYNKDLSPATTKRALKSLSPAECYKDKVSKANLFSCSRLTETLRMAKFTPPAGQLGKRFSKYSGAPMSLALVSSPHFRRSRILRQLMKTARSTLPWLIFQTLKESWDGSLLSLGLTSLLTLVILASQIGQLRIIKALWNCFV